MPTAWRIVKTRYAARAFDGEGARLHGGRWTSAGRRAVYTADSAALATLEVLVHLQSTVALAGYSLIPVTFDASQVRTLPAAEWPPDWQASPPSPGLQAIGDRWLDAGVSPVLQVPSAIVPSDSNYILNPEHPDCRRFAFGKPVPYRFDPRLLRRRT